MSERTQIQFNIHLYMVAMLYGAQKGQDRVLWALIWAHDSSPLSAQLGSYYCSAYDGPRMRDTFPMVHMLCIHHGVYAVYPHKCRWLMCGVYINGYMPHMHCEVYAVYAWRASDTSFMKYMWSTVFVLISALCANAIPESDRARS